MRASSWLAPFLVLLPFVQLSLDVPVQGPEIDLGGGIEIVSIEPWPDPLPPAVLERVAEHVGRPTSELEDVRLYRGAIRRHGGPEEPCDLVAMPLSGPARGGLLHCAVGTEGLLTSAIWGALDFDADPTARWGAFLTQLQSSWSLEHPLRKVELSSMPAREVERWLARSGPDEESRLARALVEQRIAMRKNASLNLVLSSGRIPRSEWLADLSGEMKRVASLSKELTPLLGQDGARQHARLASALSATYADIQSLLDAAPEASPAELSPDLAELGQRASADCAACHDATSEGKTWRELFSARREELGLAQTLLRVGYDVAPALGDDGEVSREIADKIRAGMLLVEAARE